MRLNFCYFTLIYFDIIAEAPIFGANIPENMRIIGNMTVITYPLFS